jgi:hypothetical protein
MLVKRQQYQRLQNTTVILSSRPQAGVSKDA